MSALKLVFLASCLVAAMAVLSAGDITSSAPPTPRYAADSAKRAKLPAGSNEVVFLGSSTLDYWTPFFPGKKFVNRGIAGETLQQLINRFQQDVVALKPKAVVIYGGSNDLAANAGKDVMAKVEKNYKKLHALAHEHNIKVIQLSANPTCGKMMTNRPPKTIATINKFLKALCIEKKDSYYADTASSLMLPSGEADKTFTKSDCLHPNAKGYEIMNKIVLNVIEKAIGKSSSTTASTKSTKSSESKELKKDIKEVLAKDSSKKTLERDLKKVVEENTA